MPTSSKSGAFTPYVIIIIIVAKTLMNSTTRFLFPFVVFFADSMDISVSKFSYTVLIAAEVSSLIAPFFGHYALSFGTRKFSCLCCLMCGMSCILNIFFSTKLTNDAHLVGVCFLRLTFGLFYNLLNSAIQSSLSMHVPNASHGRITGFVESSWTIAGFLFVLTGFLLRFGWKAPFVVNGVMLVIVSPFVYFYLPEDVHVDDRGGDVDNEEMEMKQMKDKFKASHQTYSSKSEAILGYSSSQIDRNKALTVMGETELSVGRIKALELLGVDEVKVMDDFDSGARPSMIQYVGEKMKEATAPSQNSHQQSHLSKCYTVLKHPSALSLIIYLLLNNTGSFLVLTVYSQWALEEYGLDAEEAGIATLAISAGELIACSCMTLFSDSIGLLRNLVCCGVGIIFTTSLLALFNGANLGTGLFFLGCVFILFEWGLIVTIGYTSKLFPKDVRVFCMTIVFMMMAISRGIGANIAQPLWESRSEDGGGFTTVCWYGVIFDLVGVLVLICWNFEMLKVKEIVAIGEAKAGDGASLMMFSARVKNEEEKVVVKEEAIEIHDLHVVI